MLGDAGWYEAFDKGVDPLNGSVNLWELDDRPQNPPLML